MLSLLVSQNNTETEKLKFIHCKLQVEILLQYLHIAITAMSNVPLGKGIE